MTSSTGTNGKSRDQSCLLTLPCSSNLVLLKVHDKVVAHVSTELFKDACISGVQLDDPAFWHDVGYIDGLRYTWTAAPTRMRLVS